METLFQDIRYGLRVLRKSPAFTVVAVLTLALGIGANTAIFSLINAVLLKMLPVHNPTELAIVGDPAMVHTRSNGTPSFTHFSYPLYKELSAGNHVFNGLLASSEVHRTRLADANSKEITQDANAVLVSGNYFSVLGVNALFGRVVSPDDDKAADASPVAVLGYDFWKSKFAGSTGIIGQTIRINNSPFTVIGVAPQGFYGDTVGDVQDLWVPITTQRQLVLGRDWLNDLGSSWVHCIGRLRTGVTVGQAQADINVLLQQLIAGPLGSRFTKEDRETASKAKIQVVAGGSGFSDLRGDMRQPLFLLMAIVGFVLMIASVNVANLLLARATARQKEIAVRMAIGATSLRVIRQLLTESVLLGIAGGAIGLLFARWGTAALLKISGNTDLEVSPDASVLAFTAAISVTAALLFGLIPALRSRTVSVAPVLKAGTQGAARRSSGWNWGDVLVAAQVAVSLLVLFTAGLLIRSLQNLRNVDLGYSREHLLLISTDPRAAGLNPAQITNFGNEMAAQLASLPGVRAVTYSKNGLFSGSESGETLKIPGYTPRIDDDLNAAADEIGPDYFKAIGIPMLLGRDIGSQDTATSPKVAVINESMAKFYFGKENPIGRKFAVDDEPHRSQFIEIVGVARDARDHTLRKEVDRRFYIPFAQSDLATPVVNFEVRLNGGSGGIVDSVRKLVKAYNSGILFGSARPLDRLLDRAMNSEILIARLSSFFAGLALVLACIGLYGLLSYSVTARTREIGVRVALGATRSDVLWMILQHAFKLLMFGVVVGLPLSLLAARFLGSMLFGTKPTDLVSMATVILVLGSVATLAGLIPARRATKVDPMIALRYE
jgi:predicted permease